MKRIYLSPPHMCGAEQRLVAEAFSSNWIAPLGPHVDAFERGVTQWVGVKSGVALASGTASLHLALLVLGVRQGDRVLTSTFTFASSANVITYVGAEPVLVDSEPGTWNMSLGLLEEALDGCQRRGEPVGAVIAVDLYGQCADYEKIEAICGARGVPLIEDAAEALGATAYGKNAGQFGRLAAFSFNGNKIITTSGGGMLVSDDEALIERARHLATQARDPAPHYQHSTIGYNYRMSNLLAAVGRGQLQSLEERVVARRKVFERYVAGLGDLPGISFMPEAPYGRCTRWLTCLTFEPREFGATREDVRLALEAENIESRPVWKPMHLQPVFAGCRVYGGDVSARLFENGLCLPSGSNLSPADQDRVIGIVRKTCTMA